MTYASSEIPQMDKDITTELGRITILQFAALDMLIAKTYESIIRRLDSADIPPELKVGPYNNPYEFTKQQLALLESIVGSEDETPTRSLSKRITDHEVDPFGDDYIFSTLEIMDTIDVFKIYKISYTVQKMLSHVIPNIRKIQDFRVEPDTVALQRSNDLYGTDNQADKESLEYFVSSTEQLIADAMANANPGMTIDERVMELIIELVQHTGYLIKEYVERFDSEKESSVLQEQRENRIRKVLFPALKRSDSVKQYLLSALLEDLGFTHLFDLFDADLPRLVFDVEDSEILSSPISLWGPIFVDSDPELFDILTGLIPTVVDRYRLPPRQSLSEAQRDLWPGAVTVMEEFLKTTFSRSRTDEIEYLVSNPSADQCLWTLRNLRVLVNKSTGVEPQPPDPSKPSVTRIWNASYDKTYRIPFNFMINWLLSEEKELGEPFRYALSLLSDEEKMDFFDGLQLLQIDKIIPSAMFQGALESSELLPKGGTLIDLNYNKEQKNKQILLTRLGRPKGLESALSKVRMP